MKKNKTIFLWILSIIITVVFVYENPEKIENIKNFFKKDDDRKNIDSKSKLIEANSFSIEFTEVFIFENSFKTSFIVYEKSKDNFDKNNLSIYFQDKKFIEKGNINSEFNIEKFTDDYNGGIKSVFIYKNIKFIYVTMLKDDCYYVSIINTQNNNEIFKSKCLKEGAINFNGVGSTHIHYQNKILLSIGAPGWDGMEIANLAQNQDSFFGKIIEIDKEELDRIILNENNKINPKIFSFGHRNPQGLTILENKIFSTEHGPRGGDELNRIIKGKNYGWPKVSYGVKYRTDLDKIFYSKSHENDNFEEPLFALVPSVGISSLNICPLKLREYYKKPCLIALSLYGNDLREGKSIILYLLNNKMTKVHSIEKIYLGEEFPLRHFVTNSKNELYEDLEGNIYVSVDGKGIYRIKFEGFDQI